MVEAMLDKSTTCIHTSAVIGYEQDITIWHEKMCRSFETHYIAQFDDRIVGDVNPTQVKQLAQVYFGRYKAKRQRMRNSGWTTQSQLGSNVTALQSRGIWKSPSITQPSDNAVYDIVGGYWVMADFAVV